MMDANAHGISNTQNCTCLPALHLSPLFRAIVSSVESTSSLIFIHGLKEEPYWVLTGSYWDAFGRSFSSTPSTRLPDTSNSGS